MGNSNFEGWEEAGRGMAAAHPSLALIKYWGKSDSALNIPATPSLAVSLNALETKTEVQVFRKVGGGTCGQSSRIEEASQPNENCRAETTGLAETGGEPQEQRGTAGAEGIADTHGQAGPPGKIVGAKMNDRVFIDSVEQPSERFEPFFANLRAKLAEWGYKNDLTQYRFIAKSRSNFPSSAGLASSASGFAALTAAVCTALKAELSPEQMSQIARVGSASAARCFWGGFVKLSEGEMAAEPAAPPDWWPELRVIVLMTEKTAKPVPSRKAMEICKETSPFFSAWVENSKIIMKDALKAVKNKDLDALGGLMQQSYMQMFSTMFSANPPIVYWNPMSLTIINLCRKMRSEGISVWETMDAGPQVKLLCTAHAVPQVLQYIKDLPVEYRISETGGAMQKSALKIKTGESPAEAGSVFQTLTPQSKPDTLSTGASIQTSHTDISHECTPTETGRELNQNG